MSVENPQTLDDALIPPPPELGDGVIHVSGVNHHYGEGSTRTQILRDINLDVRSGEVVIVKGPSGSGKSTLLVLIGTLRGLQTGSIQIDGTELLGAGTEEILNVRRKIGFIFQAHNLFGSLTAYENVKMALQLSNDRSDERKRIEQLLTDLDLGHRIYYRPKSLSGGQRQRVAIARGIVHKPRIVLADEPTAALDAKTSRIVVNKLRALAKDQGSAVVMVTHDNRVMDIADRVITVEDGAIKSDTHIRETELICRFLDKVPLFQNASQAQWLAEIAAKMHRVDFQNGEKIIQQGDDGKAFYLIRNGNVSVRRNGDQPQQVAKLGEGEYFGEMSLAKDQKTNADVVADGKVVAYALGKSDFKALLKSSHAFDEEVRRVIYARQ
ncbi:ATP-binding cassette domain-containing protein [Thalassoroseus pseudoceratinae]|uniref:ATP-binding cassette domain-containing protein n=1 Tax=Thalassoroseus pseudoceratinae TaxID=2713176 RepID=UPI00141F71CB|nr:ATP-binding cassette domain-containing protein [Thalassoroseus pseudoceratinae]